MDARWRERDILRRAEKAAHAAGAGFYPYTRELGEERSRRNQQRSAAAAEAVGATAQPVSFRWSGDWLRPLARNATAGAHTGRDGRVSLPCRCSCEAALGVTGRSCGALAAVADRTTTNLCDGRFSPPEGTPPRENTDQRKERSEGGAISFGRAHQAARLGRKRRGPEHSCAKNLDSVEEGVPPTNSCAAG